MIDLYYNKIPTMAECDAIREKEPSFSKSTQEIDGHEIVSYKYNLSFGDMWEHLEDGRINMRGITFVDGKLSALPFPKFFNHMENDKSHRDFDSADFYIEKVDGSLLCPIIFGDDNIAFKTMKSVHSDTAYEANTHVNVHHGLNRFCASVMDDIKDGWTPMFEYVSNTSQCKIVIDYGQKALFYLGKRNMHTGEIVYPHDNPYEEYGILSPRKMNHAEYIEFVSHKGVEGVIGVFSDGMILKKKTPWYCEVHRVIGNISVKRILEAIVNETIDDMRGIICSTVPERINDLDVVENEVRLMVKSTDSLLSIIKKNVDESGLDRKGVALKYTDSVIGKVARMSLFNKLYGDNATYQKNLVKNVVSHFKDEADNVG
jgi:T4 RnlA family RNA ligase